MSDLQPNTIPSIVPTPMLRVPQTPPEKVIATRRRSIAPVVRLQQLPQGTPLPQAPVTPMPVIQLSEQSPQTPFPPLDMMPTLVTPLASGQRISFPIPRPKFSITLRLPGITYIPRMMTRRNVPSVIDALFACGTLLLIGLCVLMLLYYFSM